MSATLTFTVLGRPQPAGSKRAFPHARTGRVMVVDDARHSRAWKQDVAHAALVARRGAVFTGAVELDVTFFVCRPKWHYGTGRNADTLKPNAPAFPTTRPDTTKLVRAGEDALTTAGVWRDDAQVADQHAHKRYGTPERCEITITAPQDALSLKERAA